MSTIDIPYVGETAPTVFTHSAVTESDAKDRFVKFVELIETTKDELSNYVINSSDTLEEAKERAKNAAKIVKAIEDRRVELTKPFLQSQRNIAAQAKTLTDGLETVIKSFRGQILTFEQEEDRKRRIEIERVAALKRNLSNLETETLGMLHRAKKQLDFTEIIKIVENIDPAHFKEFSGEAEALKQRLIIAANSRWETVKQEIAQSEAAAKLGEEERLKAEEQIRINKEAEDKRQEEERIAAEKAQIEADAKLRMTTKSIAPASGNNLRTSWKFEILNPGQIPNEYLMPDEKKIKEAIKNGVREISGVRIYPEEGLVLR